MYKLLVADDEEKLLSGLCNYYPWEDLGFHIAAKVKDGKQALEYMLMHDVDVVLTDISMPEVSGIELAEMIQRDYPEVIVIFLSGYADFKYAQKAVRYGVKEYILKPVKTDEIKRVFTSVKMKLDSCHKADKEISGYYDNVVDKVKNYIMLHISDATLERAAEIVAMNASYLSTLYKQKTGETFSEMLLKSRMELAKEMLGRPELKIYDIASSLGYENAKSFSRAFRCYYGYTPREERNHRERTDCTWENKKM